jgi:hypothetical protein
VLDQLWQFQAVGRASSKLQISIINRSVQVFAASADQGYLQQMIMP